MRVINVKEKGKLERILNKVEEFFQSQERKEPTDKEFLRYRRELILYMAPNFDRANFKGFDNPRDERAFIRSLDRLNKAYTAFQRGDVTYRDFTRIGDTLVKRKKPSYLPSILLFSVLVSSLFIPSITGASIYNVADASARNYLFVFGSVLAVAIAFFCFRK
ncbi:MAG TPA: hypothetical protein VJB94_03410 [Candidatus Nanoarchaeia archaeon]|nr:hypothetical protein [Candidatus Nanoarchaeia archaeon]